MRSPGPGIHDSGMKAGILRLLLLRSSASLKAAKSMAREVSMRPGTRWPLSLATLALSMRQYISKPTAAM